LDEDEARDFVKLAVFAGGCTLEAAEAVCGTSVERLASLVDDNLLRRTSTVNGSRYAMLETIREYALERLQTTGDYETACRAHAEYYLALAEHDVGEIDQAERAALDRLERELDNFRASFAWALKNNSESALKLAAALRSHWFTGRQLEGREWLTAVLAKSHPPSHDLAALAGELARLHFFLGELEAAVRWVEQALELAESLELPDVLSDALNTKHLLLARAGRYDEALALLEQALVIAREHELDKPLLRALYNLSFQMTANDRQAEARQNDLEGLELARQRTDWWFELVFRFNLVWGHLLLGNWDAALRVVDEGQSRPLPSPHVLLGPLPWLHVQRGDIGEARRTLDAFEPSATGLQGGSVYSLGKAVVLRAEGLFEDALFSAEEVLARRGALAGRHGYVKLALIEAVEAAFALDDLDRVSELVGEWPPHSSDRTPFVDACCEQFGARLAARSGAPDAVEPALRRATAIFRELERPFYVAVALLEHGEWLVHQGRVNDAQPLLAGAEDTFQKLKARPWLDRCRSASQIGTWRP
jgi:tetratricopeptide (TPR) repeat protein